MSWASNYVSNPQSTRAANSTFIRHKKIILDLSFHQIVLIAPQPLYYIVCEFMKVCGQWQTVYYPKPGAIVGWILLILVLWAPQFVLYYMIKRYVDICDKLLNPQDKSLPFAQQV